MIDTTAMLLILGATQDEVDEVWNELKDRIVPAEPSGAIAEMRQSIEKVRERRASAPREWLGDDLDGDDSEDYDIHDEANCQFCQERNGSAPLVEPIVDEVDDWAEADATSLADLAAQAPSGAEIAGVMLEMSRLLLEKNIAYGDSALDPMRIASQSSAEEQLLVRIDDKLSRISRGTEFLGDDTISDLIGYLVLLKVARAR